MALDQATLQRISAAMEWERRNSGRGRSAAIPDFADFVPRLTPRFARPAHLRKLLDLFERIRRGEIVRCVVSTPPRHGKTETLIHGIAYLLDGDPSKQIAYVGYASTFAEDKSRKARELARAAGVPISPEAWARKNWRTGQGDGGCWATSIGGPLTGQGFHCMIVDDPVKDRATAESATFRQHTHEWFNDTAFTRLEPTGSCIVVQTRWHPDDLAGRLIAEGWEFINLPAIDDAGVALWPERWPVERLREIEAQLGEYGWTSLYQGQPRSRGGSVFRDPSFYTSRPSNYNISIGVDFAYSTKTYADYSVAVVLAESLGSYYVLDVYRQQVEAPAFGGELARLQQQYRGAPITSYIGGTEKGMIDFMARNKVKINALPASEDKFTRAQPVAAAWNAGKVLLPESAPWLEAFLGEVGSFTGVKDRHDDQVDALAGAFSRYARPLNTRHETGAGW